MNRSHARGTDKLVVHGAVSVAAEHDQLRVQGRPAQLSLAAPRTSTFSTSGGLSVSVSTPETAMSWICFASRCAAAELLGPPTASPKSQVNAVTTRNLQLRRIASSMAHSSARWPAGEPSMPHTMMCSRPSTTHLQRFGPARLQLCSWGDRLSTRPRNSRPGLDRISADPDAAGSGAVVDVLVREAAAVRGYRDRAKVGFMNEPKPVVVVTGANGLVGSRICEVLAGRGATVRAVVRRAGTGPDIPGVEEHVGEFHDPDFAGPRGRRRQRPRHDRPPDGLGPGDPAPDWGRGHAGDRAGCARCRPRAAGAHLDRCRLRPFALGG